jgi:hypothetical protein
MIKIYKINKKAPNEVGEKKIAPFGLAVRKKQTVKDAHPMA